MGHLAANERDIHHAREPQIGYELAASQQMARVLLASQSRPHPEGGRFTAARPVHDPAARQGVQGISQSYS